jgi:flavin reductase (DIM6/NTAB) family NADH-FMN oxidoreductase RutF
MFYDPTAKSKSLPHDPFKAIVAPRPIGWISSISTSGVVNLAPYSFFNGAVSRPPVVMFSSEGRKDTVRNIDATKEFVCNLATWDLREAMNKSSGDYPPDVNEMVVAGLTPAPCRFVKPPRVAEAPCALECKLLKIVRIDDVAGNQLENEIVFGQVVGIHIADRFLKDGILDTAAMQPIARCGYRGDYARVDKLFEMIRPG